MDPGRRRGSAGETRFRAHPVHGTYAGGDCPLPSRLMERAREDALLNEATLLWGMLFGCIGLGFFVYGKKQGAPVPLVCGLAMMAFPYFVSSAVLTVLIGLALIAIPYFVRV